MLYNSLCHSGILWTRLVLQVPIELITSLCWRHDTPRLVSSDTTIYSSDDSNKIGSETGLRNNFVSLILWILISTLHGSDDVIQSSKRCGGDQELLEGFSRLTLGWLALDDHLP